MAATGQRIGYIRVSSGDQNPERQLEGESLDCVFVENASGKDTERPKLRDMLDYAREGDLVVVHSMDRLARNVVDLRCLVRTMTAGGISVTFRKENLTFTGNDTSVAQLMLTVLGAVAEFERDLIRERQRDGIALAMAQGVYRGRKKSLSPEQEADLVRRAVPGSCKAAIAREFGISRETVYRYLRQSKPSSVTDED